MSVIDHPTREAAARRGELAADMVASACELACLVRDGTRDEIGVYVAGLTEEERVALLIVQAAMIPDDVDVGTLLAWVTWDEYGRPLPGASPAARRERALAAPPQAPRRWREEELKPCGSHAAFNRHKIRGELIDDECAAGEKSYQDAYYALRKQRAADPERISAPAGAERDVA